MITPFKGDDVGRPSRGAMRLHGRRLGHGSHDLCSAWPWRSLQTLLTIGPTRIMWSTSFGDVGIFSFVLDCGEDSMWDQSPSLSFEEETR